MLQEILLLAFLFYFAWTDIRSRSIWWPPALFLGIAGILLRLLSGESGLLLSVPAGCIPALLLLPGALPPFRSAGAGDIVILLACGAVLGFFRAFELLLLSLLLAAFWSVFLLIGRRADRHRAFPFIPFLLAAQIIRLFSA